MIGGRRRRLASALLAVFVARLVTACSTVPASTVQDRATALADAYSGAVGGGEYLSLEWWKSFDDPVLDRIVETVLVANFDLAEAVARVEQASVRAHIANAETLLPTIQPSIGANDFETSTNAGIGAQLGELGLDAGTFGDFGFDLPDRFGLSTYSLGANFSYELDFWGRARNAARAAGAERLASESDFRTARIGILAETVRTYLEIVDLRRQRLLTHETIGIVAEQADLAVARYELGLAGAGELYSARRKLGDAQAALPPIEGRLADAQARLWILLGGFREDLADMLPDSLSPAVALDAAPAGVPADLLMQRPDVGAARQRMEAARYALGARRAELLPSLSLAGSIGLQSADSDAWFDADQWFHNLTLNLLGPALQGARLQRNVALAEARLDEAAAAFGRTVVTAVGEVEAALAGLEASRRRHGLMASIAHESGIATAHEERRYASGVGDYADYLAAAQTLVGAKSALAAAERDLGFARLALHRALGGAWADHGPPVGGRRGGVNAPLLRRPAAERERAAAAHRVANAPDAAPHVLAATGTEGHDPIRLASAPDAAPQRLAASAE